MSNEPIKEINTDNLIIEIYKDGDVVIYEGHIFGEGVDISKEDMELIIKEYKKLIKE